MAILLNLVKNLLDAILRPCSVSRTGRPVTPPTLHHACRHILSSDAADGITDDGSVIVNNNK